MNMPTVQEVRELIRNRPAVINLSDISTATGCSESWLKQFIVGKIEKPGYDKICSIVSYLENKKA
jgi:predicted transcriptional regulator